MCSVSQQDRRNHFFYFCSVPIYLTLKELEITDAERIKIETATTFQLPNEELLKLYKLMALSHYSYLRKPNYNEASLLKQLKIDLAKFITETNALLAKEPNNHTLHRINHLLTHHITQLNRVNP